VKIKDLVDIQYGKSANGLFVANGPYPIVGTGGVIGYTKNVLSHGPAVVIERKGTIDKPQFISTPFWAIDTTFYCTPKDLCDIHWFFYATKSIAFKRYGEASGVPSLSRASIGQIALYVPGLREQKKIAKVLMASDALIEAQRKTLSNMESERAALMQQLLTGKRRVKLDAATQ